MPKFPDLSASASGSDPPMVAVQGTPGSISGPMSSPETPSALTTAPEVSPPATTSCRTPASTSPDAILASASSTIDPVRSAPNCACAALTSCGAAVA